MKRVIFSKEEKEQDHKDVEKMLREEMSCTEIAKELGRSPSYICDIKQDLDRDGILTQEELDKIKQENIKDQQELFDEFVLEQLKKGKNRSAIHKATKRQYWEINAAIDRLQEKFSLEEIKTKKELEKERKLKQIEALAKKEKSVPEISRILDIPKTTIINYLKELISEGRIEAGLVEKKSEEERKAVQKRNEEIYKLYDSKVPVVTIANQYDLSTASIYKIVRMRSKKVPYKAKKAKEDYEIKEIDVNILSEEEIAIIQYLKEGFSYGYIVKKRKIFQNELMKLVNKLKQERYITQTIINNARKKRKEYYSKEILSLLKLGYTQAKIHRAMNSEVEEISRSVIFHIIEKLKSDGLITEEGIQNAIDNLEESMASIDKKVLGFLKEGKTVKEIIDEDITGVLTKSRITSSITRLIESKKITKEQIKQFRLQREQEQKRKEQEEEFAKIWKYIKEFGYLDTEIADLLDVSENYVYLKKKLLMEKKKLTYEQIRKMKREARRKREEKERKELEKLLMLFQVCKSKFKREYTILLPTETTKRNFYELFKQIDVKGMLFEKEDILILKYIVFFDEVFSTLENVQYVIQKFIQIQEFDLAEQTLNEYTSDKWNQKGIEKFRQKMLELIKNVEEKLEEKEKKKTRKPLKLIS